MSKKRERNDFEGETLPAEFMGIVNFVTLLGRDSTFLCKVTAGDLFEIVKLVMDYGLQPGEQSKELQEDIRRIILRTTKEEVLSTELVKLRESQEGRQSKRREVAKRDNWEVAQELVAMREELLGGLQLSPSSSRARREVVIPISFLLLQ